MVDRQGKEFPEQSPHANRHEERAELRGVRPAATPASAPKASGANSSAAPASVPKSFAPAGEVVMNPALARKQQLKAQAAAEAKAKAAADSKAAVEAKRLDEARRAAAVQSVLPSSEQEYQSRYAGMSQEDLAPQLKYFRELVAMGRGQVPGMGAHLTEEQMRSMEYEIAWLQNARRAVRPGSGRARCALPRTV